MAKQKLTFIRGTQASNVAGTIWFDTAAKVIKVGDGTNWDIFDGKIKDASFVNGVLTIEKYGADSVVLNLSTLADAKAVANAFKEVQDLIDANAEDIKSIQDELNSLSGGAGSIATQIENAIAKLDVEDTVVEGQYVSGVSEVDGKISVSRAALPDYTEVYDAKGAAATAEQNAKAYADGKFQVAGNYEAAGAAAQALADAKSYADGKFQVAGDYEAAGTADAKIAALDLPNTYEAKGEAAKAEAAAKSYADGLVAELDGNLKEHVENGVIHITADERTAWNAAKTAIDTFLKDADMTEKAVDTLAELQTYMTTDGEAATQLVNRVAALEAIDHDAYKAADTALETSLKGYVDGKVDGKFDAAGAAAAAETAAKAYADGLAANYEVAGAAKTAEDNAKAYADGLAGNYDAAGSATAAKDAAIAAANAYTDGKVDGKFDAVGSAAQALVDAKAYTDQEVAKEKERAMAAEAKALADAKEYTDSVFMWAEF